MNLKLSTSPAAAVLAAVCIFLPPTVVSAQSALDFEPGSAVRTRDELERLLETYMEAQTSSAYSTTMQQSIAEIAERVRARLRDGDFMTGDRVVISVAGEAALQGDSLTVEAGPTLPIPGFGEVDLHGVLRSELQDQVAAHLGTLIRNPDVRTEGLMRLSVQGAVGSPGYYEVPADMVIGSALRVAGGPEANADRDKMSIERGQLIVLEGFEMQEAIRLGRTLDQLNLQAGDEIVVPAESTGGILSTIGVVAGIAGSIALLVFQLGG